MKRNFLLILFLFCGICHTGFAQSFDVNSFWEKARLENKEYQKYTFGASRFRDKCKQKHRDQSYQAYLKLIEVPKDTLEKLLLPRINALFLDNRAPLKRLIVVDDYQPNASITSFGVLEFTVPLLQMLDVDELLGVVAHEMVHYKLLHPEINFYAKQKKARDNEIWAGVITGLYAGASMVGPSMSASAGVSVSQSQMNQIAYNNVLAGYVFSDALGENAEKWGYKYTRQQELEADMIAAQLMDELGIGRNKLISAFEKLRKDDQTRGVNTAITYGKSDHPGWDERIYALKNFRTLKAYLKHRKGVLLERDPLYN